jgi:hypothetical protein
MKGKSGAPRARAPKHQQNAFWVRWALSSLPPLVLVLTRPLCLWVAAMADDKKDAEITGTVKLISADGHEFVIDRKAAMVSGTIRSMLSGPSTYQAIYLFVLFFFFRPVSDLFFSVTFTEQQLGEINFREISTPILEKVCQYFYYKLKYANITTEIPEFPIEPEIALELLMAANFLDT